MYSEATSGDLNTSHNLEMPANHALLWLHTTGTAYSLYNTVTPSSHLVPHSPCYYPHFTGRETKVQGSQVLPCPRSCWELPYSHIWLHPLDLRSKALCSTWEAVRSSFISRSRVDSILPGGPPTDCSPHISCPFLSDDESVSLVPLQQTLMSATLNHRDLSSFDSQKVKGDGLSIIAMLKHPPLTLQSWSLLPEILLPKMVSLGAF